MTNEISLDDIQRNLKLVNDALNWGEQYRGENFRHKYFKDKRRELRKIGDALSTKSSAAAYGESQVGKSYLMGSLLSTSEAPLMIRGNGRDYNFVNELNQSGGSNNEVETTGVITRFTLADDSRDKDSNFLKVRNLSVVDIILLLTDSYYNDVTTDAAGGPDQDKINEGLISMSPLFEPGKTVQTVITEDDIRDIADYIDKVIGRPASAVLKSNFADKIASVISSVGKEHWGDVFSLLWNGNPHLTRLFNRLIEAYSAIDFSEHILLPFDAVLRTKGTLLKIDWLDGACGIEKDMGKDVLTTEVYSKDGQLLSSSFPKAELCALIAELTFEISGDLAEKRPFLREMDLLDFPGARSRESIQENQIDVMLPTLLRRGKVAYLFNKYSRSLQIGSVLFCHHNDQKSENKLGDTITKWIEENIGESPESRRLMLADTDNVSPLFFVATKFNKDLERMPTDTADRPESLDEHWGRFDKVIPEIIGPATWMDSWTVDDEGRIKPFPAIFPLRGFQHSAKAGLFKGFSEGEINSPETSPGDFPGYPDYMEKLRNSFLSNEFVSTHLEDPQQTWEDVATINNDGSRAIISSLDRISGRLENARKRRYLARLRDLRDKTVATLQEYFVPDKPEEKIRKVKESVKNIRQDLTAIVSENPTAFGKILETFMVEPEQIRNLAHAIIVRHTEVPQEFRREDFLKANAGININESKEISIEKLKKYLFLNSEEELRDYLKENGFEDPDTLLSPGSRTITTVSALVARRIMEFWENHLDKTSAALNATMPHVDAIIETLRKLSLKIGMENIIEKKIKEYLDLFSEREQPTVIGDFASLALNRFVATCGSDIIDRDSLVEKAASCDVELEEKASAPVDPSDVSLEETLRIFDMYSEIINNPQINRDLLSRLPFWNTYREWENSIIAAMVYTSDITDVDPVANAKMGDIINEAKTLYA